MFIHVFDLSKNQFLVLLIFLYFFLACFLFHWFLLSFWLFCWKSVSEGKLCDGFLHAGYLLEISSHGREESETSLVRGRNLTVMASGKCQTTLWRSWGIFRLSAVSCLGQKCLNVIYFHCNQSLDLTAQEGHALGWGGSLQLRQILKELTARVYLLIAGSICLH